MRIVRYIVLYIAGHCRRHLELGAYRQHEVEAVHRDRRFVYQEARHMNSTLMMQKVCISACKIPYFRIGYRVAG